MITPKELADQITKAMEGVTKGPWRTFNGTDVYPDDDDIEGTKHIADCSMTGSIGGDEQRANATFFALCNPDNMRVILSALADAERERDYHHDRAMRLAGFLGDEIVQTVIARADAAEQELTDTQTANHAMSEDHAALKVTAAAQTSLLEEARGVLEWYASPEIYQPHPHGPAFDHRDLSASAKSFLSKLEASSNAKA
ncbi:hypothetical protein [Rhizobium lusitanum]|uniref:hypothetical protein n=1 Tax=Rhizobium lusitanum TaxID=293958 RepID=UPI00195B4446|nr:hypothetical protein [Rhizobium lusitanum]MBM7046088.1 hypothetical protein [Rhizobium lusitanum]